MAGLVIHGWLVVFGLDWLKRWLGDFDQKSPVTQGIVVLSVLVLAAILLIGVLL